MVSGGVGSLIWIIKGSLNFTAKAWWTLMHHQLSPTSGDNVLSPNRDSLVASIMEGYEIDTTKIIAREIYNRMVITDIALSFSCILTQLCLDLGYKRSRVWINFTRFGG